MGNRGNSEHLRLMHGNGNQGPLKKFRDNAVPGLLKWLLAVETTVGELFMYDRFHRLANHAFTLIELLIVVAIIAILAAIAVPNFLEAQVRSKVSRVKTDMRTMATAVEAYAVDNNSYPYSQLPVAPPERDWVSPGGFPLGNIGNPGKLCGGLTTPIAYITSLPIDVFDTKLPPRDPIFNALHYIGAKFGYDRAATVTSPMPVMVPADSANGSVGPFEGTGPDQAVQNGVNGRVPALWTLFSYGPDQVPSLDTNGDGSPDVQSVYNLNNIYDPTNGTVSPGNVVRLPG